jgi:transposase
MICSRLYWNISRFYFLVRVQKLGSISHVGKTLKQVEEPDDIESILVDRATLPKGDDEDGGIETRQVVDIEIIRHVTEYQAQVLMNKKTGERYVAPFPEGVTKAVQ